MIVKTINQSQFISEMRDQTRKLSIDALKHIYDFYCDVSEYIGRNIEFNAACIADEWTELIPLELFNTYKYFIKHDGTYKPELFNRVLDELSLKTEVLYSAHNDTWVVRKFKK